MGAVRETDWEEVWSEDVNLTPWEYHSEVILHTLKNELGSLITDKLLMAELGCGSGRVSLRLAEDRAASIWLLDISANALKLCQRLHRQELTDVVGSNLSFVRGSLFDLPGRDGAFDVLWNGGVIEHWSLDQQRQVLTEAARLLAPEGLYITMNPNAGCVLHNIGKVAMRLVGRDPYEDEVPIQSLEPAAQGTGLRLAKEEYSIGFIMLFVGVVKRLMVVLPGGRVFRLLMDMMNSFMLFFDRSAIGGALRRLDQKLCRMLGGFLLVSVLRKES